MPSLRYYGAPAAQNARDAAAQGRGIPAAPSVLSSSPPPLRFPTGVIEHVPPPAAVQAGNTTTAVPTPPSVPVVTPTKNVWPPPNWPPPAEAQQNAHLPPPPNMPVPPPANMNAAVGGGIVGLAPVVHDGNIEQIRRQNDGAIEQMISAHIHKMQNAASAMAETQQALASLQQQRLLQQQAAASVLPPSHYVGVGAGSNFVDTTAPTAAPVHVGAPAPVHVPFHQQYMNMPPPSSIPVATTNNTMSHVPPPPGASVAQQPFAPVNLPVPVPAPYPNQTCAAPSTSASSMPPPKFELNAKVAKAAHLLAKDPAQPPICLPEQHPYASVAGATEVPKKYSEKFKRSHCNYMCKSHWIESQEAVNDAAVEIEDGGEEEEEMLVTHPHASVAGIQPNPLAVQEVSVGNGMAASAKPLIAFTFPGDGTPRESNRLTHSGRPCCAYADCPKQSQGRRRNYLCAAHFRTITNGKMIVPKSRSSYDANKVQNQNCNTLGLHQQQHLAMLGSTEGQQRAQIIDDAVSKLEEMKLQLRNQGGDPTLYPTQAHPSSRHESFQQQMAPPADATGPKPESLLLTRAGVPVAAAAPTMDTHEASAPESPEGKRYHVGKRPTPRPKNSYNYFFRHQSQKLKRRDLVMILMRKRLEIYRDKHRGKEADHLVSPQLLRPDQFNRTNHIANLWGSDEYVCNGMRYRFEAMADCEQEHYRTVVEMWQAEETYDALEALDESSGLDRDLLHQQIKESIENMDQGV